MWALAGTRNVSQPLALEKYPRSHCQVLPVEARKAFAGISMGAHVSAVFTNPRRQIQRSPAASSIALAGTTTAVQSLLPSVKPRSHFHPFPYGESIAYALAGNCTATQLCFDSR